MGLLQDVLGYINDGRAASSVSNSNIAAEHGVLGATATGQQGITNAVNQGRTDLSGALQTGTDAVSGASTAGNATLHDILMSQTGNLDSYLGAGKQGIQGLQDYAASKPQFNFNYDDYKNSPAFDFQMKQGQNAIENSASARGLGASGSTLKELTNYGQGLASTYYNDAFNRAQQTFNTNQNATMQNLGALINTGEYGTSQYNKSLGDYGSGVNQNLMTSGLFSGTANLDVGSLLAKLGLSGAESSGQLGLRGAEDAGNFAVGAGTAHAGGILGQGNILGGGVSDLSGLIQKLIPMMGGG